MPERSIEYKFAKWTEDDVGFNPFIPVTIKANGQVVPTNGLIDSGSNTSYVDFELAEDLGFDLSKLDYRPVGGLGGDGGEGRIATVRIYVNEFDFEYESHVVFTNLHAQIMLLGQRDFFQHFNVNFLSKQCKFIVTKTATLKNDL